MFKYTEYIRQSVSKLKLFKLQQKKECFQMFRQKPLFEVSAEH